MSATPDIEAPRSGMDTEECSVRNTDVSVMTKSTLVLILILNAIALGLSFTIGASILLAAIAIPICLFLNSILTFTITNKLERQYTCLGFCYIFLTILAMISILSWYMGVGDTSQGVAGRYVILMYVGCTVGMIITLSYVSIALYKRIFGSESCLSRTQGNSDWSTPLEPRWIGRKSPGQSSFRREAREQPPISVITVSVGDVSGVVSGHGRRQNQKG